MAGESAQSPDPATRSVASFRHRASGRAWFVEKFHLGPDFWPKTDISCLPGADKDVKIFY